MKPLSWMFTAVFGILSLLVASQCSADPSCTTEPVSIIFDTDMGSDCDDAGALALLHRLADLGEAEILAVMFSSGKNRHGVGVCDAINTHYGRGDLPLGQYKNDDIGDPLDRYCRTIATDTKTYAHDVIDSAPELLQAYKRALRNRPDDSVTIVTVGHPHALSFLIKDPEGLQLVLRKVKRCVSMGGAPDEPQEEWNLCRSDVRAHVAEILRDWPTSHAFSPAGSEVVTGHRTLPSTPESNPVREAYRLYDESLKKGRPSWDQIAVLGAVRPGLFKSERGTLKQLSDGRVQWTADVTDRRQFRITPLLSNAELAKLIEELMSAAPQARR